MILGNVIILPFLSVHSSSQLDFPPINHRQHKLFLPKEHHRVDITRISDIIWAVSILCTTNEHSSRGMCNLIFIFRIKDGGEENCVKVKSLMNVVPV